MFRLNQFPVPQGKEKCWVSMRVSSSVIFSLNRGKKTYTEKCWKDVRVGDFVQLQCNEIIPADILLLHSSDQNGICHLETASLDGETSLKQRQVVKGFSNQVGLRAALHSLPFLSSFLCKDV